jgi:hypothetical protein
LLKKAALFTRDVDTAEFLQCGLDRGLDLGFVGDVADQAERAAAGLPDVVRAVPGVGFLGVDGDDRGASAASPSAMPPPDVRARAGDDRDPVL